MLVFMNVRNLHLTLNVFIVLIVHLTYLFCKMLHNSFRQFVNANIKGFSCYANTLFIIHFIILYILTIKARVTKTSGLVVRKYLDNVMFRSKESNETFKL